MNCATMPHSEALLKAVNDLSRALERANTSQTEALLEIQERAAVVERAAVNTIKRVTELERRDRIKDIQIKVGYAALGVLVGAVLLVLLLQSVR
jgi:hypothetical protein